MSFSIHKLPLTLPMWPVIVHSDSIVAHYFQKEESLGEDGQKSCNKIKRSIFKLWAWLMIPYLQKIKNWHSEREILIKTLQNQCIDKARIELEQEKENKGKCLALNCCQIIEDLKTSAISAWDKQFHQDYCVASNLSSWETIKSIFQSEMECIQDYYHSTRNIKSLRKHLTLARQPIV